MSKTTDPRIAPKEMIVTRFKSAQQRRQLRDKDRSMTKVTELLKSPQKKGRKKKSTRKEKTEDKSAVLNGSAHEDETKEYYPEKLKRAPSHRKEFLKHKQNLKTVARTNKRKFNTPKKGDTNPLSTKHKTWSEDFDPRTGKLRCRMYSSLSMKEMVRLVEDTESLDDEDLMEILTCPSPVWWEDHDVYGEEPISTRSPEESAVAQIQEQCLQINSETTTKKSRRKSKSSKVDIKCNNNNSDRNDSNKKEEKALDASDITNGCDFKEAEKTDARFKNKRRKLENVLGNIKSKVSGRIIVKSVGSAGSNRDLNDNDDGTNHNQKTLDSKVKVNDLLQISEDAANKPIKCEGVPDIKHLILPNHGKAVVGDEINEAKSNKFVKLEKDTHTIQDEPKESTDLATLHKNSEETIDLAAIKEERKRTKVKKISESTEEEIADLTADDDMLLDLENMDIPIENGSVERCPSSANIIFINDDEGNKITIIDDDLGDNTTENHIGQLSIKKERLDAYHESNKNQYERDNRNVAGSSSEISMEYANLSSMLSEEAASDNKSLIDDKAEIKLIEVPKNLPPLKKRPKIENTAFPSPVSYRSTTDDTTESSSVSSHDISDTISDTNIKFIMDDDIEYISDVETKNDIAPMKNVKEEVKKEDSPVGNEVENKNQNMDDILNKDYITVYKIVPNDNEKSAHTKLKNIPEYTNYVENFKQTDAKSEIYQETVSEGKGQLNSFFKKCKNANRKRCKKSDDIYESKSVKKDLENSLCDACEPKKSITVAQDENVKYCLKCSSIFDTDECSYCLKSLKESEVVSNVAKDIENSSSNVKNHLDVENSESDNT